MISVSSSLSADLEHLARIERQACRLFEGHPETAGLPLSLTPAHEYGEAHERGHLWVARSAGFPIGFALVEILDGHAHLEELDVLPEHGRRGVGRALVQAVGEWAGALPAMPYMEMPAEVTA